MAFVRTLIGGRGNLRSPARVRGHGQRVPRRTLSGKRLFITVAGKNNRTKRASVIIAVLSEVFILAAVGLAISVPLALGASKFVESFLFGMKANDPLTVALAVVTLLAAALWQPAMLLRGGLLESTR